MATKRASTKPEKVPVKTEIEGVAHEEGTFESHKTKLFYQKWSKGTSQKGLLVLVHGMGDHSGHMMTVVEHLVSIFDVYGYDNIGHGKSPGERGVINSWSILRDSLNDFLAFVDQSVIFTQTHV